MDCCECGVGPTIVCDGGYDPFLLVVERIENCVNVEDSCYAVVVGENAVDCLYPFSDGEGDGWDSVDFFCVRSVGGHGHSLVVSYSPAV